MMPYDPNQDPKGPRKTLLDKIPVGSRVLDVGCWTGYFARYLVDERACSVVGVERHVEAAQQAEPYCESVIVGDLNQLDELDLGGPYDSVLLLDVLEHVESPESVLTKCRELAPTGRIYASIPNVAHWSVRKMLLSGRWTYTDAGILDRSHLRFYTPDSANHLLETTGLTVEWRDFSPGAVPLFGSAHWLEHRLARWRPTLFAIQSLFVARC
jgi:SAM-dependent methyltransferase